MKYDIVMWEKLFLVSKEMTINDMVYYWSNAEKRLMTILLWLQYVSIEIQWCDDDGSIDDMIWSKLMILMETTLMQNIIVSIY